jgi:hypothetical protein
MTEARRFPNQQPHKPVLLLMRLHGQPATAYYVTTLALAERLADDADHSGDLVEIRSVKTFPAAAAVAGEGVKPGQLRLLGIQRDDGRWVQPPGTALAASRRLTVSDDKPDPMTVVKIVLPEYPPDVTLFCICLRSTADKLAADAGPGEQVSDLGPAALALTGVYEHRKRAALGRKPIRVGVARGDRWLMWFLPSYPVEPVPGSSGSAAQRN